MEKVRLSIVIPVYNVELYIRECLASIFTKANIGLPFEVIVVDDESSDNSMLIAENFSKNNKNLHILHQKNQGQGVARNFGLEIATGDYVWFVDSDDWIEEGAIRTLLIYFDINPEISVFTIPATWKFLDNAKNCVDLRFSSDYRLSGRQYLEKHLQLAAWQFVVKRRLLVDYGIRFFPDILHEDGLWGFELMYLASYVLILSTPLYCYRQREIGSVMHNISIRSAYDLITIHKQKMRFLNSYVTPQDRNWFMKISMESFEKCVDVVWHLRRTPEFRTFLKETKTYRYREIDKCIPLGGLKWKLKCFFFKMPVLNKCRRIITNRFCRSLKSLIKRLALFVNIFLYLMSEGIVKVWLK